MAEDSSDDDFMRAAFDEYWIVVPGLSVKEWKQRQIADLLSARGPLSTGTRQGVQCKLVRKKDRGDFEVNLLQIVELVNDKWTSVLTLRLQQLSDQLLVAFGFQPIGLRRNIIQ